VLLSAQLVSFEELERAYNVKYSLLRLVQLIAQSQDRATFCGNEQPHLTDRNGVHNKIYLSTEFIGA